MPSKSLSDHRKALKTPISPVELAILTFKTISCFDTPNRDRDTVCSRTGSQMGRGGRRAGMLPITEVFKGFRPTQKARKRGFWPCPGQCACVCVVVSPAPVSSSAFVRVVIVHRPKGERASWARRGEGELGKPTMCRTPRGSHDTAGWRHRQQVRRRFQSSGVDAACHKPLTHSDNKDHGHIIIDPWV